MPGAAPMAGAPGPAPSRAATGGIVSGIRRLLGLSRKVVVEGVRYREVTAEPMRRALSRKGSGKKEYDVAFPGGARMRIACAPHRLYADLMPAPLLGALRRAEGLVRPGMRLIVLGGGTGFVGSWAARGVGPSGAVVVLESDEESVRYAERRYPMPNVAFERGGVETLAGETDGAFDAALAIGPLGSEGRRDTLAAELWRVVREGGWVALLAAAGPAEAAGQEAAGTGPVTGPALAGALERAAVENPAGAERSSSPRPAGGPREAELMFPPDDPWVMAVMRKPAEEPRGGR